MNEVTPRLYVAATQQNDGKTTTCVGLFSALSKRFGRIGFIKPVGQRFVNVNGTKVDEDSILIDKTYHVHTPLEAMSPIAIDSEFTRRYISNANPDFFVRRLQNSFDRTAWEKDFIIIEGSGHAGVGSVFDMSNARVAKLLNSKAVLVTKSGIGRAVDEATLNKALFDQEGVELVGVILNKCLPDKLEFVRDYAGRGLARLGIELLGVMPVEPILTHPLVEQVPHEISGRFLGGRNFARRRIRKVIIGAMSAAHVGEHLHPGTLMIIPGDREDIMEAAIQTCQRSAVDGRTITGIVVCLGMVPRQSLVDALVHVHLPIISSPLDTYSVASRIYSMTVKTLPGDHEKIDRIQSLIDTHVNVERLLEKL